MNVSKATITRERTHFYSQLKASHRQQTTLVLTKLMMQHWHCHHSVKISHSSINKVSIQIVEVHHFVHPLGRFLPKLFIEYVKVRWENVWWHWCIQIVVTEWILLPFQHHIYLLNQEWRILFTYPGVIACRYTTLHDHSNWNCSLIRRRVYELDFA